MASLEDTIYDKLVAVLAAADLSTVSVYKGWRPQSSDVPCVTFLRISTEEINGAAGTSGTRRTRAQIDTWSSSATTARTIANAIRDGLDGWTNTSSPAISPVRIISDQDLIEQPDEGKGVAKHRVSQDYSLWWVT